MDLTKTDRRNKNIFDVYRNALLTSEAFPYLRDPLLSDVLVWGEGEDAVAEEEDVCVRVGEGPQPVVLLLPGRVKQSHLVAELDILHWDQKSANNLLAYSGNMRANIDPCLVDSVAGAVRLLQRHLRRVVLEHGGDIVGGELVAGVADKQAGLAHPAIPHHHTLQYCGHHTGMLIATVVTQFDSLW